VNFSDQVSHAVILITTQIEMDATVALVCGFILAQAEGAKVMPCTLKINDSDNQLMSLILLL
jgi:hypothetical protein